MQSGENNTRRFLKILAESSRKETFLSVIILIIRAMLPLLAIILLRHFVDMITGAAVSGTGNGA
ncbi:MAG: hypothetical protein EP313_09135, partial [Bacteroidetes bacterium]